MFEKVLVISELHYHFDYVLHGLLGLKKLGTRSVLLVQCLNPQELNDTVSTFVTGIYKEHLDAQEMRLTEHGFAVTTRQMIGVFRDSINELARNEQCGLVVVGAPERTMLGSLLDGGAAYHMMHGSLIPLLLVRTPPSMDPHELKLPDGSLTDHLLFPTDFSENAARTFDVVRQIAAKGIRKVTLLHVQDKAKIDPHLLGQLEAFNQKDTARLEEMAQTLRQDGCEDVSTLLLYGSPTSEILRIIADMKVTSVIMGSQGRGWIREIYLGNVSHSIARHASVPVLLIPFPRSEGAK